MFGPPKYRRGPVGLVSSWPSRSDHEEDPSRIEVLSDLEQLALEAEEGHDVVKTGGGGASGGRSASKRAPQGLKSPSSPSSRRSDGPTKRPPPKYAPKTSHRQAGRHDQLLDDDFGYLLGGPSDGGCEEAPAVTQDAEMSSVESPEEGDIQGIRSLIGRHSCDGDPSGRVTLVATVIDLSGSVTEVPFSRQSHRSEYSMDAANKNLGTCSLSDTRGVMIGFFGPDGLTEAREQGCLSDRFQLPAHDKRHPASIIFISPPQLSSQQQQQQQQQQGKQPRQNNSFGKKPGGIVRSRSKQQLSLPEPLLSSLEVPVYWPLVGVDLSENGLSGCLPTWLLLLPRLKNLHLADNRLNSFPLLDAPPPCLEILSLANNSFDPSAGVPPCLAGCTTLSSLDLSNFLENRHGQHFMGARPDLWAPLARLQRLSHLILDDLNLGCIPTALLLTKEQPEGRAIACVPPLVSLSVKRSGVIELPKNFEVLGKTLTHLDLGGNSIAHLGEFITSKHFPLLKELLLNHNSLTSISFKILECPCLSLLDLESNYLRSFDDAQSFDKRCLEASWAGGQSTYAAVASGGRTLGEQRNIVVKVENNLDCFPPPAAFASARTLQRFLDDLVRVEPFIESHLKRSSDFDCSRRSLSYITCLRNLCVDTATHAQHGLEFCSVRCLLLGDGKLCGETVDFHFSSAESWLELEAYMTGPNLNENEYPVARVRAAHSNGLLSIVFDLKTCLNPSTSTYATFDAAPGACSLRSLCSNPWPRAPLLVHGWATRKDMPLAVQIPPGTYFVIQSIRRLENAVPTPLRSTRPSREPEDMETTAPPVAVGTRRQETLSKKGQRKLKQSLSSFSSFDQEEAVVPEGEMKALIWNIEFEGGPTTSIGSIKTPVPDGGVVTGGNDVITPGMHGTLAAVAAKKCGLENDLSLVLKCLHPSTARLLPLDTDEDVASALASFAVPLLVHNDEPELPGRPRTPVAPDLSSHVKRASKLRTGNTPLDSPCSPSSSEKIIGPAESSNASLLQPLALFSDPRPPIACPSPRRPGASASPVVSASRAGSPRPGSSRTSSPRLGSRTPPGTPSPRPIRPLRVFVWGKPLSSLSPSTAHSSGQEVGGGDVLTVVGQMGALCDACRGEGEMRLETAARAVNPEVCALFAIKFY